ESSPNIGGQELQAIAQMVALKRAGHRVVLACREHSRIAEEAKKHAIRVVCVPFRNSLHLQSVSRMRQIIRVFRPAMVVCHSGHDSNIVALTRASLPGRAGRFCIIRQKTYLTRKMKMFSLNNLCDAVVVPGAPVRDTLMQAGCRRLIAVVPPGFDFGALRQALAEPVPEHIERWLNGR
ncbi:glycosyltransferase, partial [Escherichia coli]|uniref:glycosyltransferase n=1 Tax=Escherichia coli TaxID=562 RepID=UPI00191A14E1